MNLMPEMKDYAAKCDSNADVEKRKYVALLVNDPDQDPVPGADRNFIFKVIHVSGRVVYEKKMTKPPAAWHLGEELLFLIEDYKSKKILMLKLGTEGAQKSDSDFYTLQMPADLNIKRKMVINREIYIQGHACEDKDALRDIFKQRLGEKEPDSHIMCYATGRLVILANQEIVFFRPSEVM